MKLIPAQIIFTFFWTVSCLLLASSDCADNAEIVISTLPTKVFNFERFKEIFDKSYPDSHLEELVRHKIFLGRALRAFLSFVGYRHYRSDYHLKINELSDWTQGEIDSLYMKETPIELLNKPSLLNETPVADDIEDVKLKLARMISSQPEVADEFGEFIENRARRKRDVTTIENSYRQSLSYDNLFPDEIQTYEKPESSAQIASNNPDYLPPELASHGGDLPIDDSISTLDDETARALIDSARDKDYIAAYLTKFWSYVFGDKSSPKQARIKKHTDILYIDHRRSGCINPVRNQKKCGSCYIFSTTTLYEWQYCKEAGVRVSFSEQYPLDCGERVKMKGCRGGSETRVAKFYGTYGFELADRYRYQARSDICPYDEDLHPKHMGYLRLKRQDGGMIMDNYEHIGEWLETRPVAVGLGVSEDFSDYGGGVYDGHGCRTKGNWHSMVIVGRGLEDGEEYWLMRNSYGPSFGVGGYYKLNVKAKHCFSDNGMGFMLEPDDGEAGTLFNLNGNWQYDSSFVKKRSKDYKAGNRVDPNPYNRPKRIKDIVTPKSLLSSHEDDDE